MARDIDKSFLPIATTEARQTGCHAIAPIQFRKQPRKPPSNTVLPPEAENYYTSPDNKEPFLGGWMERKWGIFVGVVSNIGSCNFQQ
jgi:hypothetical protein